ncbi:MAG: hypothetical protein Ct9H300mP23_05050 [Nitrospinota bacterium]|nr:MAG: hypothetical protein Ct9H300mP23_05050 [Nitrospinota bacterium]
MEIGVEQVKQMMDNKKPFRLIDVREPPEYDICKIGGRFCFHWRYKRKRPVKTQWFKTDEEIVLHCKAGVRPMKAAKGLRKGGLKI